MSEWYVENLKVIKYLLDDGFTEEQLCDLYIKNKKYFRKDLVKYHIERINQQRKEVLEEK